MPSTTADATDADLIHAVRSGDLESYGLLFARHREAANRLARQLVPGPDADDLVAESFSRVMAALQSGKGPDEFFRAYLLSSIRRLHIDRIRAGKRVRSTGDEAELDRAVEFIDPAEMKFEHQAAADAFASLPERWQMVLWHLDVEQHKPAQVAPLLGMSANSVSALAYRAREGLRVAYLQNHLAPALDPACKTTTPMLGQYVRKALRTRDTAAVEAHLDTCSRCSGLYLELVEVNGNLSGLLAPALLGAAAAGYLTTSGTLVSVGAAIGALPGKLQSATSNSPAAVAAASAATLTVVGGAVALGLVAAKQDAPPTAKVQTAPATAAPSDTTKQPTPKATPTPEPTATSATPPPAQLTVLPAPAPVPTPPTSAAPTTPAPTPTPTQTPRPAPTPTPTPTLTPTPTPTPTPTVDPPDPVPTDYAATLAFTNEPSYLQRLLTVIMTAVGDEPTNAAMSVDLTFAASSGAVRYRGGLTPEWDCGVLAVEQIITTMTCTRVQNGPAIPPLLFSLHGSNPHVIATVSVAGHIDPSPANNTDDRVAANWEAP